MEIKNQVPLPKDSDIPKNILEELKNHPPLNIIRLLTLVPETFQPWLDFVAGLYKTDFDPRLREIAICRYGFKAKAPYELHQHTALAKQKGVTKKELDVILSEENVTSLDNEANFICKVVDEFEDLASLKDETFKELFKRYDIKKAMTLLITLGHYSCVVRVLNSARVPLEEESPLKNAGSPTG